MKIGEKIKELYGCQDPIEEQKRVFLIKMALSSSIASAIRHQSFYSASADKQHVREQWMILLLEYSKKAHSSLEEYAEEVYQFTNELVSKLGNTSKVKLAFAQKSLSVFLKYLWCYGIIETAPACPVDYYVLSKAKENDSSISTKNWTALDDKEEYLKILRALKKWKEEGKTIAEKELRFWNNIK